MDEGLSEKLQAMEADTTQLKDSITALKADEKELRQALREGTSQIPLTELKASVDALVQQKAGIEERLAKLKGGNLKPVSPEERDKVNAEHRRWQKTAAARKKIRFELWKEIEAIIEKEKVDETKEELGLEF